MDVNRRRGGEARLLDIHSPLSFLRVKPDELEAPSRRTPFRSVANWSCKVDTPQSLSRFLVRAGVVAAYLTLPVRFAGV